ncbi:MAG: hypothetical protein RQ824_03475 [bacterium]|nr:hypothetical protein [bacterium]
MDKKISGRKVLERGIALLTADKPEEAIPCFQAMLEEGCQHPLAMSCLGLAMARAGKDLAAAEEFSLKAIEKKPYTGEYYRSLAEVYLISGKRKEAIECIDRGLKYDSDNKGLFEEMKKYGIRKKPALPFLPRSSFLNKNIGILLSKLKKEPNSSPRNHGA